MTLTTPTRALLLLAALAAGAQTTPVTPPPAKPKPKSRTPKAAGPSYNTNLVVLDAAHGGADTGAKLGDNSLEKDATVALAALLKARLESKGFTVLLTHNTAADDVPLDTRVETINRSRAVACLLLHASNGGHGVHLYTSALMPDHPSLTPDEPKEILPWDTAQASVLPQSIRLSSDLAAAINGMRVPLVVGQSSVKPLDSLSCPAVAFELAPLAAGDSTTPANDPGYQARVADSVAQALVFWRGHVLSIAQAAAAANAMSTTVPATAAEPTKPAPKPKPKPVPPPVKIPDEEPLVDTTPAPRTKPAPIVRPAPPAETAPPNGGNQ